MDAAPAPQPLVLDAGPCGSVSALLQEPRRRARALYVMGHGAGHGITDPQLVLMAQALAARRIATLRFNFPYMERGDRMKEPDRVAQAFLRGIVGQARALRPRLPLIAGGKSYGARISTQAQSQQPLAGIAGLALMGFPLHHAGEASLERAAHLWPIRVPLLFLSGTLDDLAYPELLAPLAQRLGRHATLRLLEGTDHVFRAAGRDDAAVAAEAADAFVQWTERLLRRARRARAPGG